MGRASKSGLPYLLVRKDSGKYAYHRLVPADIAPYVVGEIDVPWSGGTCRLAGKTAIKISLKTGDDRLARSRWSMIEPQVDALVQLAILRVRKDARAATALSQVTGLTPDDIRILAEQERHDRLSEHDRQWLEPSFKTPLTSLIRRRLKRLVPSSEIPPSKVQAFARKLENNLATGALKDRNWNALNRGIRESELGVSAELFGTHPSEDEMKAGAFASPEQLAALGLVPDMTTFVPGDVDRLLASNGVSIAENHPDRRALALALLRANVRAASDINARENGAPIETPPRPTMSPSIVDTTPTIRELLQKWLDGKGRSLKTVADATLYVERFVALRGDLKVNAITKADIREFRDTLAKFPRNLPDHLKSGSPREIVAWAEANPNYPKLGKRTINEKAIGGLSKLLAKAVKEYDEVTKNPCLDMKLSLGASDIVQRKGFSPSELRKIFHSPIYQTPPARSKGCGGEAAHWLPLLSLFTGGRQEELGQLLTSDVYEEDGISIIKITTVEDDGDAGGTKPPRPFQPKDQQSLDSKTIKTEAGLRRIPIHQELIRLGFLAYVAERRAGLPLSGGPG